MDLVRDLYWPMEENAYPVSKVPLSTVENLSPICLICFACALIGADLLLWKRRVELRLRSGVKNLSVGLTVSAREPFSGGPSAVLSDEWEIGK